MAEQETIYSGKGKYGGFFDFAEFYKFCFDYLSDEIGLNMVEKKYAEKLEGDTKKIDIEWAGSKKLSDYFKFDIKVKFQIIGLQKVEINQGGAKISTNKGTVETSVSGSLVRDYQGKFETSAFNKFLRSIYEKWVITSRVDEMEGYVFGKSEEFINQVKAWLDLEGKK